MLVRIGRHIEAEMNSYSSLYIRLWRFERSYNRFGLPAN